jgi:hypothetical protein
MIAENEDVIKRRLEATSDGWYNVYVHHWRVGS